VAHQALELLNESAAVLNIVHLHGAARKPDGDVILCDVAREDASVIIGDLKELGIEEEGSIAIEHVDSAVSQIAKRAERAAPGLPSDAVVWEDVEARTSEETQLSINFVEFMMIATLIAAVGILLDSSILIVGAMIVGPEFGPIAALCVAIVERRRDMARRSFRALAVGFPVAILVTAAWILIFRASGLSAGHAGDVHPFTRFISHPDFFSFFIAYLAGTAGVLSLTSAKSGALIGVLVSVTTIPAAANIAVAGVYENWSELGGAASQLAINLGALVLGGVARLYVQHRVYSIRRRRHLRDAAREAAGLPTAVAAGAGPRRGGRR
jgi:uncharacterized hydrophobic protein (TIGR00271 family)